MVGDLIFTVRLPVIKAHVNAITIVIAIDTRLNDLHFPGIVSTSPATPAAVATVVHPSRVAARLDAGNRDAVITTACESG